MLINYYCAFKIEIDEANAYYNHMWSQRLVQIFMCWMNGYILWTSQDAANGVDVMGGCCWELRWDAVDSAIPVKCKKPLWNSAHCWNISIRTCVDGKMQFAFRCIHPAFEVRRRFWYLLCLIHTCALGECAFPQHTTNCPFADAQQCHLANAHACRHQKTW